eukprot:5645180-Amphidinium_carterae.1
MPQALVFGTPTMWHIAGLDTKAVWAQRGQEELHVQSIEDDAGNVVAKVMCRHIKWMYRTVVDMRTGHELFSIKRMARYGPSSRNVLVQRGGVTLMTVRREGWRSTL